jgi:putative oxidoreductase
MDSPIDRKRLIVPGMAGVYQGFAPYSYAFMRFVTGAILVPHGLQKIFTAPIYRYVTTIGGKGIPLAEVMAYLVFFTESVAAICLAIGLFTRIAAAMVGIQMLVITFVFQWQYGYFWTNRGLEFALMWALLCIAIWF